MGSARSLAIANENRQLDESTARAAAARPRRMTALEIMADRFNVSVGELKNTLVKTVFAGCRSESEFLALCVVANEYGLNPLTKEIYAFPAKGGGVVPMVGVDGWIRLMNSHPEFDGIEFDYHNDQKGATEAIESIIYRKDRTHPIKVIEYMEECERATDPWKKSPRRMLRHRALIQGARVAFGFSGIVAEGDEEDFIEGTIVDRSVPALPSNKSLEEELGDEIPAFDKKTGEIIDQGPPRDPRTGMTEVDEETARQLDNRNDGTLSEENPSAAEGPADEQRGEPESSTVDWVGEAKPTQAQHGQSWYNPADGKTKYAHLTQHGIKWYVDPPKADAPQESAEPRKTAFERMSEETKPTLFDNLMTAVRNAKDQDELDEVQQRFADSKEQLKGTEITAIREAIATKRNELS